MVEDIRPPDRPPNRSNEETRELRRGWTTGACAAAAARAAAQALLTGRFPDPVSIVLPQGQTPIFPLARSELGTTGVVVPFSCAAWIHSIHRGIDVARAAGATHVAASTGSTSEAAVQALYQLPDLALIDMGDFAGGMLKYLRSHPIPRLTLAG